MISGLIKKAPAWRFGPRADVMAAQIEATAQAVVALIEEKLHSQRHDHRRSGHALFVVLGEAHSRAAQMLAHMRVVQALHDRGHVIAVGVERPGNMAQLALNVLADHPHGAAPARALAERLQALPQFDRGRVIAASAICDEGEAELTSKLRTRTWVQNNISLSFNDAARSGLEAHLLDMNDDRMKQVLAEDGIKIQGGDVEIYSPLGMRLRNHVMLASAREQIAATGARIFIQVCGNVHVAGGRDNAQGLELYEHSLTGLLAGAGEPVIGVALLDRDFTRQALPHDEAGGCVHALTLQGPSFRERPLRERDWLQAVLPHVMTEFDLDDERLFEELLANKAVASLSASAPEGP